MPIRSPLLAFTLLVSTGCQSGYLIRQGLGQLGMSWSAIEIGELPQMDRLAAELGLDESQKEKMALIPKIRRFAAEELGLETGDAYTTYYHVENDAISHTVTAAHPLAMIPYRWRFPVVGEVTYKGYFEREHAEIERDRLRAAGFDTEIGETAAFSTLGWFRDPVLSTMLDYTTGDLVDLIIHELVHRTLYYQNATAVNESLATALARAGARRFLHENYGSDSPPTREYERGLVARDVHREILFRLRADLESLFRSDLSDETKREHKGRIFARASRSVSVLLAGGRPIELPTSNAYVLARVQYLHHLPLFTKLVASFEGRVDETLAFLRGFPDAAAALKATKDRNATVRSDVVDDDPAR